MDAAPGRCCRFVTSHVVAWKRHHRTRSVNNETYGPQLWLRIKSWRYSKPGPSHHPRKPHTRHKTRLERNPGRRCSNGLDVARQFMVLSGLTPAMSISQQDAIAKTVLLRRSHREPAHLGSWPDICLKTRVRALSPHTNLRRLTIGTRPVPKQCCHDQDT